VGVPRTFLVTGGTSGLGFEVVSALAAPSAFVHLTGLTQAECDAAIARLGRHAAFVRAHALDLASLAAVGEFAERFVENEPALDVLVCNAGVFGGARRVTADGFEGHIGINHLGHFALTGRLWRSLCRGRNARVVTVTSAYHRLATLDLDDPHYERRAYERVRAYGQSKLANVLCALELGRRSDSVTSVVAHPGYIATTLVERGYDGPLMRALTGLGRKLVAQPVERGAQSVVLAATDPAAASGECFGPSGFLQLSGSPARVDVAPVARDPELARRLWLWSERATGVSFP
jgi:NAD(P)-dependent dehydrogenase (short-subunit alcohol dehydrogenase family)